MIPIAQSILSTHAAYRPVLETIDAVLITPADLAAHWRYTENHLSNLRNAQKGLPWVKLPTGGIRYRMSEVLAAELAGTEGPLTLERVEMAVAAAPVPEDARAKVLAHLRALFSPGAK